MLGPGANVVESTLTLSDARARFSEIVDRAMTAPRIRPSVRDSTPG